MAKKLRQSLRYHGKVAKVGAGSCPSPDKRGVVPLLYWEKDIAIDRGRYQLDSSTEAAKPFCKIGVADHYYVRTFGGTLHLPGAKRLSQPHRVIDIQDQ